MFLLNNNLLKKCLTQSKIFKNKLCKQSFIRKRMEDVFSWVDWGRLLTMLSRDVSLNILSSAFCKIFLKFDVKIQVLSYQAVCFYMSLIFSVFSITIYQSSKLRFRLNRLDDWKSNPRSTSKTINSLYLLFKNKFSSFINVE